MVSNNLLQNCFDGEIWLFKLNKFLFYSVSDNNICKPIHWLEMCIGELHFRSLNSLEHLCNYRFISYIQNCLKHASH